MPGLNYATQYSQALTQQFPYVLNFGDLYATPNNERYKLVNAKTVAIPSISTTGSIDSDRDGIVVAQRNYDNAWETKTLEHQRSWSTLIHPMDISQTGDVTTIANITQSYNEEQKFPEMDAYCVSKIYNDWLTLGNTVETTALTTDNVLNIFDNMMLRMNNNRVPPNGRILYVTYETETIIKNAKEIMRTINLKDGGTALNRMVSTIDQVKVLPVPAGLMKTVYDFTTGWKVGTGAKQIEMFLVHPMSVITPVSYEFAQLDNPSATTNGKYYYFEEWFMDVFILNKKTAGIQFVINDKTPTVA